MAQLVFGLVSVTVKTIQIKLYLLFVPIMRHVKANAVTATFTSASGEGDR